jgi:hexokinase
MPLMRPSSPWRSLIPQLDSSEGLGDLREEFEENFSLSPDLEERKICQYLISLISMRAVRLYACRIAAICKKNNVLKCHVGVDGAVFNKYSGFKSRASLALRHIFDWLSDELDLIALNPSEDGSGVGAALAAALTLGRETKGRSSKIACVV